MNARTLPQLLGVLCLGSVFHWPTPHPHFISMVYSVGFLFPFWSMGSVRPAPSPPTSPVPSVTPGAKGVPVPPPTCSSALPSHHRALGCAREGGRRGQGPVECQ